MSASYLLRSERNRASTPTICRTGDAGSLALIESQSSEVAGDGRTLTGTAAPFGTWAEIRDAEGHYLEQVSRSAFRKTLRENGQRIPVLLDHGQHAMLGHLPLGTLRSLREGNGGLEYEVALHDGLPQLLLEGLRSGQFGSSFRARAIKSEWDRYPGRSSDNPDQLPRVVRTELALLDIGPTARPSYKSTTAQLRSTATGRSLGSSEHCPPGNCATATTTRYRPGN
jgi:phage head maturation protease